jgi:hypothetical protein
LSESQKEWFLAGAARQMLGWPALEGLEVGQGRYLDCSTNHPMIRLAAISEDEFVAKAETHMLRWHPDRESVDRETLLRQSRSLSLNLSSGGLDSPTIERK